MNTYESLVGFEEDNNYYNIILDILNTIIDDNNNYEKLYTSIYNLRRLNKYQRNSFIMVFNVIYDRIGKILLSENESIVEICLRLLLEVFSDSWSYNTISEWIIYLLPKILVISVNNVPNSELAMMILNNCANNMFYSETITTLLDSIISRRKDITDKSIFTLRCLIQNADNTLLVNMDWDSIIDKINEVFTSNYEYATKFCDIMLDKFDKEELFYILSNIEDDLLPNMFMLLKFNHSDRVEFEKFRHNI